MANRWFSTPGGTRSEASRDQIAIGLINNMPDGALQSTERQFTKLLGVDGNRRISLRVFSMAEIPRAEVGLRYVEEHHERIEALWSTKLDGLIVTGMEPRSPHFEDEPYWSTFAKLVDWADNCTLSTVWSCLAAHAAVYRLDGIRRRALGDKLTGVFECTRRGYHGILASCPRQWQVPHSRYYELPEETLLSHGYRVITGSAVVGADIFVKRSRAFHVFLQGHPEYEAEALGLEYRRDVKRYLRGERVTYPGAPQNYFRPESAATLSAFRQKALLDRIGTRSSDFPLAEAAYIPSPPWQPVAKQFYRNWLSYLAGQKSSRFCKAHAEIKEGKITIPDALPAVPPVSSRNDDREFDPAEVAASVSASWAIRW
jgi:homoserine O-succinyltransferase/O-acetyltransferase